LRNYCGTVPIFEVGGAVKRFAVCSVQILAFGVGSLVLSVWPRAAEFRCPDGLVETRFACGGPNSKRQSRPLAHRGFMGTA
jgi:hypothetical protein